MIVLTIAKATLGDALRKKIIWVFVAIAVGLIILSFSFSQNMSFSSRGGASTDLMLIKSFGLGLMTIAGMFISLILCISLIPQEIERRTIYTILSKPVSRFEFVAGKFLGALGTLFVNIAIMGVVFIAGIMLRAYSLQVPMIEDVANTVGAQSLQAGGVGIFDINMVWAVILIFLQFMVLSSVVMMLSTFLSPTVNFFIATGVYIMGLLKPMTNTLLRTTAEQGGLVHWFYTVVNNRFVIPNFDSYNVNNQLLHPSAGVTDMGVYSGNLAIVSALYVLIMIVIAALIFQKKEV